MYVYIYIWIHNKYRESESNGLGYPLQHRAIDMTDGQKHTQKVNRMYNLDQDFAMICNPYMIHC